MTDNTTSELRLVVSGCGGVSVVEAIGAADVHTAAELREQLCSLIDSGVSDIVLDLAQLEFVDSTGLGVLVGALTRAASLGGSLVLCWPQRQIRKVLEVSGLDRVLLVVH